MEYRISQFKDFMGDLATDELIDFLVSKGFFTAPASTKYHGAYEGGLFDHSLTVGRELVNLTERLGLLWQKQRSPYIVGMFHDICKMDNYVHPIMGKTLNGTPAYDTTSYVYNNDCLLKGHGDKSVMVLSQLFKLTEEEIACIRYHMGAYTDEKQWADYNRAIERYSNVLFTHTADMIAAKIINV